MAKAQVCQKVSLEEWTKAFIKLTVVVVVCTLLLACLTVGMGSMVVLISHHAENSGTAFACLSILLLFWSTVGVIRSFLIYKSESDKGFSVVTFFCGIIAGTGSVGILILVLRKVFTVETAIYYIPITGCLLVTTSFITIIKIFSTTSRSVVVRGYYAITGIIGFGAQVGFVVALLLLHIKPHETSGGWVSISLWCNALVGLVVSLFISAKIPEDEIAIFNVIKSIVELFVFAGGIMLTKAEYGIELQDMSEFWSSDNFIALVFNIVAGIGAYYLYYLSTAMCFQLLAILPIGIAQLLAMTFLEMYGCELLPISETCGDDTDYFWVGIYFVVTVTQLISAVQLFKWNLLPFLPTKQIYRHNYLRGDIIYPSLILNIHNPTTRKEQLLRDAKSRFSRQRNNLVVGAPLYNETQLEIDSLLFSLKEIADNWEIHYDTIKSVEFHITIDGFIDSNKKISGVVERLQKSIRRTFKLEALDLSFYKEVSYGGRKVIPITNKATLTIHGKYSREDENKLVNRGKRQSLILFFNEILRKMEIKKQVDHTYLMCIDGDTNFTSDSVKNLISKLDTLPECAAVCGKIVPRGTGAIIVSPIVAFQIIEYALGHWLTKEMEEIFGTVLCSPGCFSLFRLSEINKKFVGDPAGRSVLDVFAKKGAETADFLKYDMGEDRLLCTLMLLNQAHIRYVPSATALTYCPEEFEEFFNQRRRWIASTLANMVELFAHIDLLLKSKSFTYIYLAVQMVILLSGVVSIAIILLLLTDSLIVVFHFNRFLSLAIWLSLAIVYCLSMFYFENPKFSKETQDAYKINISKLYTILVTLGNIVVIVAISSTAIHDPLNVASFMVYFLLFSMLVAFVLHPDEFFLILYFPVYVLFLPAAYLVLPLYAFCNMVDTRWGTRNVVDASGSSTDSEYLTCWSISFQFIKQIFYFLQQLCSLTLKSKTNTYQFYLGAPLHDPSKTDLPDSVPPPVNPFPSHYPPYYHPHYPPIPYTPPPQPVDPEPSPAQVTPSPNATDNETLVNEVDDSRGRTDSEDEIFLAKKRAKEKRKEAVVYYEDVIVDEEDTLKEEDIVENEKSLLDSSMEPPDEDFSSIIVHDLSPQPPVPAGGSTMDDKLRRELLQLRKDTLIGVLVINMAWIILSMAVDFIFTKNRVSGDSVLSANGLSIFFLILFGFVLLVQILSMIYFSFVRFFYWVTLSVPWNIFCIDVIPDCCVRKRTLTVIPSEVYSSYDSAFV